MGRMLTRAGHEHRPGFAPVETLISPNTTSAQLFDVIPHGFTFINTTRLVPHSSASSIVGGGISSP